MNDRLPDDTVQARMQGIRCEIDQDLEDVSARARSMVHWKHYVGAYPWVCLGAAACAGNLARSQTAHGDRRPPCPRPADRQIATIPPPSRRRPPRMDGRYCAVVAAAGIAVREAIAYLGKNAGKTPGNGQASWRQTIMIQITRPESSNTARANPCPGLTMARVSPSAKSDVHGLLRGIDRFVADGPVLPGGGAIRRYRTGMVGETTMNQHNRSNPHCSNGVAKEMGEFPHDIVLLAELQLELFRNDCREGLKELLVPVALLLFAGIVAVGTVPVGDLCCRVARQAGLSRAAAFSIATLGGFGAARPWESWGGPAFAESRRVFERSREEWTRNMIWINRVLKQPPPARGRIDNHTVDRKMKSRQSLEL